MNLPIDDKLLKAADSIEEKIIKEEILPSLSQNIEPLLSEIQRDLVLVVEYHSGQPISVGLSRKTKICEIVDAKQLTPKVGNTTPKQYQQPRRVDNVTRHSEDSTEKRQYIRINPSKGVQMEGLYKSVLGLLLLLKLSELQEVRG